MTDMHIAIAGFGNVCENAHIPALKRLNFKVVGVFDLSEERLSKARLYGFDVYNDIDEMIKKSNPQVLLISTPPSSHRYLIEKAIKSGLDVICEKPLCITLKEFDEIADLSRANDKVVFTVHNWKYSPAVSKMIELSKIISPIKYIWWNTLRKKPSTSAGSQWRVDKTKSGGGIIFDHGWHVIYILKEIVCSEAFDVYPYFIFSDLDIDEVADVRILYQNGGIGDIHLSWHSPVRKNSALCYGEKGWFEFCDDRIFYETPQGSGSFVFDEKMSSSSAHPLWTESIYSDFLKAVADRRYAEINLKEAAECIRVIEMSYKKFSNIA